MQTSNNLISAIASVSALALFAGGCAMPMEEEGEEMTKAEKVYEESEEEGHAAEALDRTPTGEEVAQKEAKRSARARQQGSWRTRLARGRLFYRQLTIDPGQTITCRTVTSVPVDPVLALVRRDDGYDGWVNDPSYDHQASLSTMAVDDDYYGRNAEITWTNPGGATRFLLIGWAYTGGTGKGDVTCTYSNPTETQTWEDVNFRGEGVQTNCDQGRVVTSGGGDPFLLVIDNAANGSNGKWNDDIVAWEERESQITNLSNAESWFVTGGWDSGATKLDCLN